MNRCAVGVLEIGLGVLLLHLWLTEGAAPPVRATDDVRRAPELIDELAVQPEELREYVANELSALREADHFEYLVQAAVASCGDVANERASIVADRLDAIIPRLRAA